MIYLTLTILLISNALAGVTNPLPAELNLKRGETGHFKFQVQAVASKEDISCIFEEIDMTPILIEFEESNAIIKAGEKRYIIGSAFVPKDVEFGSYEEKFCVKCQPVEKKEGNQVNIVTCGLPIKVNIVKERTRDNMKVVEIQPIDLKLVVLIILIGTAIFIEAYYRIQLRR